MTFAEVMSACAHEFRIEKDQEEGTGLTRACKAVIEVRDIRDQEERE